MPHLEPTYLRYINDSLMKTGSLNEEHIWLFLEKRDWLLLVTLIMNMLKSN
jgi:hypothetical protein